jgi:fermentation-respiration switch protein FrsA (DUF1100 family)
MFVHPLIYESTIDDSKYNHLMFISCLRCRKREEKLTDYTIVSPEGRTSSFAKYDYGLLGNLRRYGAPSPPLYSLSRIPTQKMLLINSARDALADPFDVARLVVELGNRVEVHTDPDFGHLDFILADTANAQIYSRILAFLGLPSATP